MNRGPEISGGAGFTYEDAVVAYYLAALLREDRPNRSRESYEMSPFSRRGTATRWTISLLVSSVAAFPPS